MPTKGPKIERDFPASEDWSRFYNNQTTAPRKLVNQHKTVTVGGKPLHNINPNEPITDLNAHKLLENLKTMGIMPTASVPKQEEGAPVETVPTPITHDTRPVPKTSGREPKKIQRMWPSDQESIVEIGSDTYKRRRALGSDAGHDKTVRTQELRKFYGLPAKASPWKELMQQFNALTLDDIKILRDMGYHPERVTNPHSITVERMLHDLHEFRATNDSNTPRPLNPR